MIASREQPILQANTDSAADNEAVLALVLRRIRLRVEIRVAWLQYTWSKLTTKPADSGVSTGSAEIDGYLIGIDDSLLETAWVEQQDTLRMQRQELDETEHLLRREKVSRFFLLSTVFRFGQVEMDIIQSCICLVLEPSLAPVFAFVQDHSNRGYTTQTLISRLFGHPMREVLAAAAQLDIWAFLRETIIGSGEPNHIRLDPFVQQWLLEDSELDEVLRPVGQILTVFPPLRHWPVQKTLSAINRLILPGHGVSIRLFITGPEGSGRKSFAAVVCQALGLPVLAIDSNNVPEKQWQQVYLHAQRQGYLDRYALLWMGEAILERTWPPQINAFNLQVIVAETGSSLRPQPHFVDLQVAVPSIPTDEAPALWRALVPEAKHWSLEELQAFCRRQQATIGQISGAARKGVEDIASAVAFIKESTRRQLGQLAQPLTAEFTWDDLIIEPGLRRHLEDLAFEATDRPVFWEQPEARRLFPQGQGLMAMFTGPPGTGKTMAAQVLANHLHLDLYRVDLASIVSKYVGETSKNLDRILQRAKSQDLVLLFDEADALFGKRTEIKDAHDRFANTDTNYLLQAIEEYPGIVLLATNRKANIDAAFLRRFRYVLEFPKPDAGRRYLLWKGLVTQLISESAGSIPEQDIRRLAELLEVTGAQVKMAILSALFMARKDKAAVTTSHLLSGIERELVKEGRGLGRHITELFNHAGYDRN
jgi:hypothetical protein